MMDYEKCGMGVQLETTCRFEMPWMDVALYFDYFGSESVNLLSGSKLHIFENKYIPARVVTGCSWLRDIFT